MPMPPPAPALFSMITGCFRKRLIASAAGRATMSATPPGGNGTIMVIGLLGYASWASNGAGNAATSVANATMRRWVRRTGVLRNDDPARTVQDGMAAIIRADRARLPEPRTRPLPTPPAARACGGGG